MAFEHIMAVNRLLNNTSSIVRGKGNIDKEEEVDRLHEKLKEIRRWWDGNCIYLPNPIRKDFLLLINRSHVHLMELFDGLVSGSNREIWDTFSRVVDSLEADVSSLMDKYDIISRSRQSHQITRN
jgi:hypothetical protein